MNEIEKAIAEDMLAETPARGATGADVPSDDGLVLTPDRLRKWERIRERGGSYVLRRDTVLPRMRRLLEVQGVKCMPRGDLISINGKEKTGKSTVCRIISAACLRGEYMGIRALEEGLRILWLDTEQSAVDARMLIYALDEMCGGPVPDDRLLVLGLRDWDESVPQTDAKRRGAMTGGTASSGGTRSSGATASSGGSPITGGTASSEGDPIGLEEVMSCYINDFKPDVVVVDGIRDFIDDFNDVTLSRWIVRVCMRLASGVSEEMSRVTGLDARPAAAVIEIIHQNKPKDDGNMTGHLGSELAKKSGEVVECSVDDDGVFTIRQTRARRRPLREPIRYTLRSVKVVNAEGDEEELGIPEAWTTEVDLDEGGVVDENGNPVAAMAPALEVVATKVGTYQLTEGTAQYLFWYVMRNRRWKWADLKLAFLNDLGLNYKVFNKVRALVGDVVVKDDSDQLWVYEGPPFDE